MTTCLMLTTDNIGVLFCCQMDIQKFKEPKRLCVNTSLDDLSTASGFQPSIVCLQIDVNILC